jgi:hypothetical protein
MYQYGKMGTEVFKIIDRFKVNRYLVKEMLVYETMLKIDNRDYWLWIGYEPNTKS